MTRPATTSRSTRLLDIVFSELEEDSNECVRFAQLLGPWLPRHAATDTPITDGWLDTKRAAEYLGISRRSLHKLTAAQAVPFAQDGPGCKCWFKRSELDAWRRGEHAAKALPRNQPKALRRT
jgi:excisionase family DNA binding protein